jgi:hypothetical protein
MAFEVACECGKKLPVTEGMAGSSVSCPCGRSVRVPSLSQLRDQADLIAEPAEIAPRRSPGEQAALWVLGILVVSGLVFCGIPFSFALAGFAGFGYLVFLTGHLWLLGLIIRECHPDAIIMAYFIPFFTWYFAIKRWDVAQWPFVIMLVGLTIEIIALLAHG